MNQYPPQSYLLPRYPPMQPDPPRAPRNDRRQVYHAAMPQSQRQQPEAGSSTGKAPKVKNSNPLSSKPPLPEGEVSRNDAKGLLKLSRAQVEVLTAKEVASSQEKKAMQLKIEELEREVERERERRESAETAKNIAIGGMEMLKDTTSFGANRLQEDYKSIILEKAKLSIELATANEKAKGLQSAFDLAQSEKKELVAQLLKAGESGMATIASTVQALTTAGASTTTALLSGQNDIIQTLANAGTSNLQAALDGGNDVVRTVAQTGVFNLLSANAAHSVDLATTQAAGSINLHTIADAANTATQITHASNSMNLQSVIAGSTSNALINSATGLANMETLSNMANSNLITFAETSTANHLIDSAAAATTLATVVGGSKDVIKTITQAGSEVVRDVAEQSRKASNKATKTFTSSLLGQSDMVRDVSLAASSATTTGALALAKIQQRLDESESARRVLANEAGQAKAIIENLEADLKSSKKSRRKAEEHVIASDERRETAEKEVARLQGTIDRHEMELSLIQQWEADRSRDTDSLEQVFKDQVMNATTEKNLVSQKLSETEAQVSQLQDRVTELTGKVEGKKKAEKLLNSRVAELKTEMEEYIKNLADESEQKQRSNDDLKSLQWDYDALQGELKAAKIELKSANKDLSAVDQALGDEAINAEHFRERARAAEKKLVKAKEQRNLARVQLQEIEDTLVTLRSSNQGLSADKKLLNARVEELTQSESASSEKAKSAASSLAKAKKEAGKLKEQITVLEGTVALEKQKGETEVSKGLLAEQRATVAEQSVSSNASTVLETKSENERLVSSLETAETERDGLQKSYGTLQADYQRQTKLLVSTENQLSQLRIDVVKADERVTTAEEATKSTDADLVAIKKAFSEYKVTHTSSGQDNNKALQLVQQRIGTLEATATKAISGIAVVPTASKDPVVAALSTLTTRLASAKKSLATLEAETGKLADIKIKVAQATTELDYLECLEEEKGLGRPLKLKTLEAVSAWLKQRNQPSNGIQATIDKVKSEDLASPIPLFPWAAVDLNKVDIPIIGLIVVSKDEFAAPTKLGTLKYGDSTIGKVLWSCARGLIHRRLLEDQQYHGDIALTVSGNLDKDGPLCQASLEAVFRWATLGNPKRRWAARLMALTLLNVSRFSVMTLHEIGVTARSVGEVGTVGPSYRTPIVELSTAVSDGTIHDRDDWYTSLNLGGLTAHSVNRKDDLLAALLALRVRRPNIAFVYDLDLDASIRFIGAAMCLFSAIDNCHIKAPSKEELATAIKLCVEIFGGGRSYEGSQGRYVVLAAVPATLVVCLGFGTLSPMEKAQLAQALGSGGLLRSSQVKMSVANRLEKWGWEDQGNFLRGV